MFIRAVSLSMGVQQQDQDGILAIYAAIGDDALSGKPDINGNHGLAKSRQFWGATGLLNSDVRKCNTFTAPSTSVR
jgi:predicted metalloprotease